MEAFNSQGFALILALIGVVIMIAALISGLIERSNLPQVAFFLALGAVLGPQGLGLLDVGLDSPVLRVVATLSLTLVLFTDAVGLNINEVRKQSKLTLLVLGPGTLLSAVLIALAAWWLLGLSVPAAVIIGASLASTDPVLLRGLVRRRDVSATARQALRLESGLNDVVLLPIVVIAIGFMGHNPAAGGATASIDWAQTVLDLFLLGPGAGVAVGLLGVATLDLVRRRIGIRRDYESIYSLGVAFAAFAAAEAVHGSGFLAAFAAGLTIAALDVELCDCFLEYGETTAEMALLFTFVLFGSSLIWSGFAILTVVTALFAVLVLFIRPLAFLVALIPTKLRRADRLLISWFGPRGLSTLLLVLLPVFEGVQGADTMFAICALVVLLSVVVHGGSLTVIGRKLSAKRAGQPGQVAQAEVPRTQQVQRTPEPDKSAPQPQPYHAAVPTPAASLDGTGDTQQEATVQDVTPAEGMLPTQATSKEPAFAAPVHLLEQDRMAIEELKRLEQSGQHVVVVDARTERTHEDSDGQAVGALRIIPGVGGSGPGSVADQARESGIPKDAWIAIFCA